ncbi:exopolysaccharide biosynthesis protein [Clostridia bacterium]|nr:exopolysaccharide biosynthesis protein [Clostridia bacterium]
MYNNDKAVVGAQIVGERPIAEVQKHVFAKTPEYTVSNKKIIYRAIKRIADFFCALLGVIIFSPVFVIIAILIKKEDLKASVFFTHSRVGINGEEINILKFRSMLSNAEALIAKFTPEQKKEYEENYKLHNDPRITKIGHFLRKTSLDELPQLINILSGDLSIVGPRPIVTDELEKYKENKNKFLSVKPGLTGYWQVNGRSDTTYDERIELEMYYVNHCSLWLDIKIMFKTVAVVFNRNGAK